MLVYLAVLDPGDEVIVFDPYYPPYPHLASMVGARVVYVSTLPSFRESLQAAISPMPLHVLFPPVTLPKKQDKTEKAEEE